MKANRLLQESSPYLLQHAYNPVDWYPWGEEALQKAQEEDKPIIVSIGYSACHWCHVMEHESFEDQTVADLMNELFVCIKVDREERPDIDQIYMEAVQMMDQRGGWPLNVFLTPNAAPFHGGTYFPKSQWTHLLKQIAEVYQGNREALLTSAAQVKAALNQTSLRLGNARDEAGCTQAELDRIFASLSARFDMDWGGTGDAPKFPMPSVWAFAEKYHRMTANEIAAKATEVMLDRMLMGGIYDQLGGGFARYSVDGEWFAPHFEKMLYDNAQLLSVYSAAYQRTGRAAYAQVVRQTVGYIQREMTSAEGGFYSALDADSEGEEGRFYTWEATELKQLLGEDTSRFFHYYGISESGNWENRRNILFRHHTDEAFCQEHQIDQSQLDQWKSQWREILFPVREERVRPGLDDKILTSWNGLMLEGLSNAYAILGDEAIYDLANANAHFILSKLKADDHLWHTYKNGKPTLMGFLEDYSAVISGLIAFYQVDFDRKWLDEASALAEICMTHFYDEKEQLFFFTDQRGEQLIARKKEIFDNVIPASNSIMARNLHALGLLLDRHQYTRQAQVMLAKVAEMIGKYPTDLANWACLYADMTGANAEVAILGTDYRARALELRRQSLAPCLLVAAAAPNGLPLLEHRTAIDGDTTYYVCHDKTCQLPVKSIQEAKELLA